MRSNVAGELSPRDSKRARRDVARVREALVDELPFQLPGHDRRPGQAQVAPLGIAGSVRPSIHVGQQRPLSQRLVRVEPLERVASQQQVQSRPEDLPQLEVDPTHCAVEVDLVVQVQPRVQEHVEGFG